MKEDNWYEKIRNQSWIDRDCSGSLSSEVFIILSNSDLKFRNKFGGIRLMNYYYMLRRDMEQL